MTKRRANVELERRCGGSLEFGVRSKADHTVIPRNKLMKDQNIPNLTKCKGKGMGTRGGQQITGAMKY